LTEIEYAKDEEHIRVSKGAVAAAPMIAGPSAAAAAPMGPAAEKTTLPEGFVVTAPMVGTVYLSPEPGKPPFVKVGDTVSQGQTLLLIEAMKTYNDLRAPRAGKVLRILVADTTPVEYGEALLILE
jgi:acetyl-CoA carboxylase biotin carboxyl carrier protein